MKEKLGAAGSTEASGEAVVEDLRGTCGSNEWASLAQICFRKTGGKQDGGWETRQATDERKREVTGREEGRLEKHQRVRIGEQDRTLLEGTGGREEDEPLGD